MIQHFTTFAAGIFASLFGTFLFLKSCNPSRNDDKRFIERLTAQDSILSRIVKQNEVIQTSLNRSFTSDEIKYSNTPEMQALRKELKDLQIKINDLRYATNIKYIASGQDTVRIYLQDSVKQIYTFADSTKNLSYWGDFNLSSGMANFKYQYRNDFTIVSSVQRYRFPKSLFKSPVETLTFRSNDTSAVFNIKTYNIPQRPVRAVFGVGAGLSVGMRNGGVVVMPALNIGFCLSIKNFKAKHPK